MSIASAFTTANLSYNPAPTMFQCLRLFFCNLNL
jgi:hypothetical protein